MLLPKQQTGATLLKRYKRFLADVQLEDGSILTVHCPNSGSMLGCSSPGLPVIISRSNNPKRKYPWTLELVKLDQYWVGVNTSLTNKLVHEALQNGQINNFAAISSIQPEVKISEKSRLDFMLEHRDKTQKTYLEVKNCSLAHNGTALFPDAVTARGTKHLEELIRLLQQGHDAALIFCIQREDALSFRPAADIDPKYADTLHKAKKAGVKLLAYKAHVSPNEIYIQQEVPVSV
ncbi:DNA/RNA nuclease SfsA [Desulfogranum japonicum]|uniref:DNA/RNA nuclease SfsA n=1 Tax=Desulfogranum japonicum TaxID=231447 RepID=UPI000419DD1B|nr:DNA/RNA nuclease SfsA [Desulfogranum japonicum]